MPLGLGYTKGSEKRIRPTKHMLFFGYTDAFSPPLSNHGFFLLWKIPYPNIDRFLCSWVACALFASVHLLGGDAQGGFFSLFLTCIFICCWMISCIKTEEWFGKWYICIWRSLEVERWTARVHVARMIRYLCGINISNVSPGSVLRVGVGWKIALHLKLINWSVHYKLINIRGCFDSFFFQIRVYISILMSKSTMR